MFWSVTTAVTNFSESWKWFSGIRDVCIDAGKIYSQNEWTARRILLDLPSFWNLYHTLTRHSEKSSIVQVLHLLELYSFIFYPNPFALCTILVLFKSLVKWSLNAARSSQLLKSKVQISPKWKTKPFLQRIFINQLGLFPSQCTPFLSHSSQQSKPSEND